MAALPEPVWLARISVKFLYKTISSNACNGRQLEGEITGWQVRSSRTNFVFGNFFETTPKISRIVQLLDATSCKSELYIWTPDFCKTTDSVMQIYGRAIHRLGRWRWIMSWFLHIPHFSTFGKSCLRGSCFRRNFSALLSRLVSKAALQMNRMTGVCDKFYLVCVRACTCVCACLCVCDRVTVQCTQTKIHSLQVLMKTFVCDKKIVHELTKIWTQQQVFRVSLKTKAKKFKRRYYLKSIDCESFQGKASRERLAWLFLGSCTGELWGFTQSKRGNELPICKSGLGECIDPVSDPIASHGTKSKQHHVSLKKFEIKTKHETTAVTQDPDGKCLRITLWRIRTLATRSLCTVLACTHAHVCVCVCMHVHACECLHGCVCVHPFPLVELMSTNDGISRGRKATHPSLRLVPMRCWSWSSGGLLSLWSTTADFRSHQVSTGEGWAASDPSGIYRKQSCVKLAWGSSRKDWGLDELWGNI